MSYILDALERSERERKQSELPSFRQDQQMLYVKKQSKAPWMIAALACVLLINAGVLLYVHVSEPASQSQMNSSQVSSVKADVNDNVVTSQPEISATPPLESSPAREITSAPPERTLASRFNVQPKVQSTAVRAPVSYAQQTSQQREAYSNTQVQGHTTQSVNAYPNEGAAISPASMSAHPEVAEVAPSYGDGEIIRPKSGESRMPSHPKVVVSETPLTDEGIYSAKQQYADTLFLHEIEGRSRPKVPKLIFNSHIYSSDPSARRVMINNIYLREGQVFQGMTLLAIDEEFVVFEKRGQQFKIQAMRDWLG